MEIRLMKKHELARLAEIDRSELVEQVYYMKNGELSLENEHYNIKGWDENELLEFVGRLNTLFDSGGIVYGAFDGSKIAGLASLDANFLGRDKNQLKLDMIYIGKPYRGQGVGKKLMALCIAAAKEKGAKKLYISATPFKNTVDFYMGLGSRLSDEIDWALFALEPFDIHMLLDLE